jgi:hypothetical protein
MNWNDYTLNPKVVLGYYEAAPSLAGAEIHRISLLRDGPTAEIVFEPTEFPKKPSKRWSVGSNTCQIVIHAIGLSEVSISCWSPSAIGDLVVLPTPSGIAVSFSGGGEFQLLCSHLYVVGLSGYINEPD